MTRSPAEPWPHPSASPRPPVVGLTPQWTPGTGALLPCAAARQQVNTVVHLRERKNRERLINQDVGRMLHEWWNKKVKCTKSKGLDICNFVIYLPSSSLQLWNLFFFFKHLLIINKYYLPVVLVSALPLRAVVPVFGLFAPREPLLTGSLGESAPGGEPGSGEPKGEACLGLAAEDFLLSSAKLETHSEKEQESS